MDAAGGQQLLQMGTRQSHAHDDCRDQERLEFVARQRCELL
jgi:hypothetical protein